MRRLLAAVLEPLAVLFIAVMTREYRRKGDPEAAQISGSQTPATMERAL